MKNAKESATATPPRENTMHRTCKCEKMTLIGNVITFLTRLGGMMIVGFWWIGYTWECIGVFNSMKGL